MNIKVNTTASINMEDLEKALNYSLSTKQKVKVAADLAKYNDHVYDMSYVERTLVELAKISMLRAKGNKELFKNNRKYFEALLTIIKLKEAK